MVPCDMSKKRYLILTENLGKTAPGLVFERLVREIASRHEVVVVCLNDYTNDESINILSRSGLGVHSNLATRTPTQVRLSKLSLSFVSDDWGARLNAAALGKVLNQRTDSRVKFDYVFSLVSFRHTSPLLLAERLIRQGVGEKNIAYFVDAIPAPLGWSANNLEFRGLQRFSARRIKKLDVLFSSNAQMLEYQLSFVNDAAHLCAGVLYNPINSAKKIFPTPSKNQYNFLYAGGLYGKRTPKHLLDALKKVLKTNDKVYLVFVGSTLDSQEISALNDVEKAHVIIKPFASDLDPYYHDAVALVDIDADMSDDVFLSSKVTNYLPVNRIILSETGKNSPASRLFGGMQSILQCAHDSDQIAESMLRIINEASTATFEDRVPLIEMFSVEAVIDQMESLLESGGL